ncbi:hypothetical protein [Pseudomonas japonica]|uniref:Uncharacterized protein n=1 Tax=Pseudomonas japonica TaxID=256466 RepID=A0A239CJM4_9PSED|nr:hypothetical protein [Pseudomonas japonica]SNS19898.1 hypothetical protein SAMN05444352_104226 [Pseudomonas japonica]
MSTVFTSTRHGLALVAIWLGLQASPAFSVEDPGRSVVHRLQQRFDDTRAACPDGSAAINCNGVLVRGISEPSDPAFWNPNPRDVARKGVSFSYIRADVGNTVLANNVGLIMRELGASTEQPLTVRCVFPSDAATSSRIESCGTEEFPLPCHLSGVVDIPTWQAHYAEYGRSKACYFEPTTQWFQFSIEVREHFPPPSSGRSMYNEVVIAPWPQDVPTQLPLEALFYTYDTEYLEQARQMQENFIRATGKFIPIVRLELKQNPVFYYSPKDQAVQPPMPTTTHDGQVAAQPK